MKGICKYLDNHSGWIW